jgi:ankyrin repeat protein
MKYIALLVSALLLSGCALTFADKGMFDNPRDLERDIEKGQNINVQDEDGSTALINSVIHGNLENVRLLLKHGANVHMKDEDGGTALLNIAIFEKEDDEKILKLLLSKGANINAKDKDGETALHYATYYGHMSHIKMLLKHGAKTNISDNDAELAFFEVCNISRIEKAKRVVDLFVSHGFNVNRRDNEGDKISAHIGCEKGTQLYTYLRSKGLR